MAPDDGSPSVTGPVGDLAPVRAAEVIGAMSMATDLGTGQPLEHALRTAIVAVRLGELAGLSPSELVDTYYISLLHSFGCTSDATEQTELFGDDIEPRARVAVSNAIWEKPRSFGLTDWERVKLHPYFTERSFAHSPARVDRRAGGGSSRAARRRRLPPQDGCAGARPSSAHPRRRRHLPGDARASPAPTRA